MTPRIKIDQKYLIEGYEDYSAKLGRFISEFFPAHTKEDPMWDEVLEAQNELEATIYRI
mgnify:CR=1 FL=1